jgi:CelD/BcsL family acetyltransferase involved in cellulose biosynthesis
VSYCLLHLKSVEELRHHAAAWDALWQRCDVTIPTAQAALLEQWLEHFGHAQRFQAFVVERDGQFLAALPLYTRRLRGVMMAGVMASNEWTPASDVLVDPTAADDVLDTLVTGLTQASWSLLWLDYAIVDAARWQRVFAACERAGLGIDVHEHFRLPRIDVIGSWDEYKAKWSRNHRQNMSRCRRKLIEAHGPLTLRFFAPRQEELPALLQCGFAIEDRSWKGAAGSSVLRSPGMFEFFERQGRLLAERGQLELGFLDLAGKPIAFMYGWTAKGIFHAFKAGYDESFAAYSPGQLLIHDILERFFGKRSHQVFDCLGPVSDATARWQTSDYAAGRVVIAPRSFVGQSAFFAYKHLMPTLRRWRHSITSGATHEPVATPV